jgi:cephalosporin hydroxylase
LATFVSHYIVFDTVVEYFHSIPYIEHPWDVGNNLKTAVHEWLNQHPEFEIDKEIDSKPLISVAS